MKWHLKGLVIILHKEVDEIFLFVARTDGVRGEAVGPISLWHRKLRDLEPLLEVQENIVSAPI